jgi:hypothetical protein
VLLKTLPPNYHTIRMTRVTEIPCLSPSRDTNSASLDWEGLVVGSAISSLSTGPNEVLGIYQHHLTDRQALHNGVASSF